MNKRNNLQASVIIVNYNGKHFLKECLTSVFNIDFPKNQYEVLMVDNNSNDTSVEFIKTNFPQVQIIESDKNLGFAGGCNLGVENALGEYVVFLNTDTKVEKDWLKYLVKRIKSDKKIAAVSSKAYIYYPFVKLFIKSDIYLRSEFSDTVNFQSVGVLVENIVLKNKDLQSLIRYRSGFYGSEKGAIAARWGDGNSSILIPYNPNRKDNFVTLTIRSEKYNSNLKTGISIKIGSKEVIKDKLESYQVNQYRINLNEFITKNIFLYEVQNAGVVIFKSGYGRDRGAVVIGTEQFYELEDPFYDKACEVHSFSGVSAILRKKIYKKMEGFDESYFMYYEDVDLSLRLQRLGYKIFFEPRSVLYHIHAGSSKEWSTFFNYNVEKNHLATLIKHFPYSQIFINFLAYLLTIFASLLKMIKWRLKEHWELYDYWREKFEYRKKVLGWVVINLPPLMIKRYKIIFNQKITISQIYKRLY